MKLRCAFAAYSLLAACSASEPALQTTSAALRGGQPTESLPFVVALLETPLRCGEPSRVVCTGALIAPRVVLTAAHCLDLAAPGALAVQLGADTSGSPESVPVLSQRAHPLYRGREHDLALLYLSVEQTALEVVSLDLTPLERVALGSELRVAGYGLTDEGELGEKHAGLSRLTEVRALEFVLAPGPALSCAGDSGGPALLSRDGADRLLGIATGGDPACNQTGLYARIDVDHASFIARTLQTWEADPPESRRVLDDHEDLCVSVCNQDADCPLGTACVRGEAGRRCGRAGLSPGRFGASCDPAASDCLVHGAACATYSACEGAKPRCALARGDGLEAWSSLLPLLFVLRRSRKRIG